MNGFIKGCGRFFRALGEALVAGFAGSTPENEAYRRGEGKEAAAHEWAETKRTTGSSVATFRWEAHALHTHRVPVQVIVDHAGRPRLIVRSMPSHDAPIGTCLCCGDPACRGVA